MQYNAVVIFVGNVTTGVGLQNSGQPHDGKYDRALGANSDQKQYVIGNWYHIALVWDGSQSYGYWNGSLATRQEDADFIINHSSNTDFLIGMYGDPYYLVNGQPPFVNKFIGQMKHIKLHHEALTASQVQALKISAIG